MAESRARHRTAATQDRRGAGRRAARALRSVPDRRARSRREGTLWIDLGGVLVRDPRPIVVRAMARSGAVDPRRLRTEYYRLSRSLDTGSIGLRSMHGELGRMVGVTVSYPTFRALVCDSSLRPIPGAVRALERLRASTGLRVVFASNVSRPIWEALNRKFRLAELADDAVLSFRVGALKPATAFWRRMRAAAHGAGPLELFVDDSASNVRSARRFGLHARRVRSAGETVRVLEGLARRSRALANGLKRLSAEPI